MAKSQLAHFFARFFPFSGPPQLGHTPVVRAASALRKSSLNAGSKEVKEIFGAVAPLSSFISMTSRIYPPAFAFGTYLLPGLSEVCGYAWRSPRSGLKQMRSRGHCTPVGPELSPARSLPTLLGLPPTITLLGEEEFDSHLPTEGQNRYPPAHLFVPCVGHGLAHFPNEDPCRLHFHKCADRFPVRNNHRSRKLRSGSCYNLPTGSDAPERNQGSQHGDERKQGHN